TMGNNEPLRGWKTDLYEGGIRVPALVNWPGVVPSGEVVEAPLHIVDWASTLIQLVGGQALADWKLDGENIWPLLTGEEKDLEPRPLYWKTPRESALRYEGWKLLIDRESQSTHLVNLD